MHHGQPWSPSHRAWKPVALTTLALLALALAAGCAPSATSTAPPIATATPTATTTLTGGSEIKQYAAPPPMTIDPSKSYTAVMHTSKGAITFELFAREAPVTVNNFVFLARDGYYDGVVFHRVVSGFMVQGGDPTGTGRGGPGYRFADEPVTRDYVRGTLAMANAGPNTNGSQFFIMHQDYPLPKNYTIFGIVTDGIEVVDALASTPVTVGPTGERSQPTERISIERIEVHED